MGAEAELLELDLEDAEKLYTEKHYIQAKRLYTAILQKSKEDNIRKLAASRLDEIARIQRDPKPHKEKETKHAKEFEFKVYPNKFTDVIGLKRIKLVLKDNLYYPMKNPEKYADLNIRKTAGLILYGAPGVGKTQLIKAISGELNLKMADIKVSTIMSKWVGASEQRIAELFAEARKQQPCILFFDEIDALGASKDSMDSEGAGVEMSNTITEFQKQVSELHDDRAATVFVIGSTNKPWDVAIELKRAGRFEHLLWVSPPNLFERMQILKYYLEKDVKQEYIGNINYLLLGTATIYYSPADLEKIAKIAKIDVIKNGGKLTTRKVQVAMKDKELGKSSLEEWYKVMMANYLMKPKFKKKEMISRGGKFTKEDRSIYKAMIRYVVDYYRFRNFKIPFRFMARGF